MVEPAVLDPFIYLVSGVLKFWHHLLHSALGLDDSLAWVIALFGLVITVRALIAPFSWMQSHSARISVVMRPELAGLDAEYTDRTDKESVAEHQRRRREIQKRYNYRPAAGCMPLLIQIPVFFGLYRVVLSMARPTESLEVAPDARVGFLDAQEINAFINAEVTGIPLPAFVAMRPELLANLGTNRGEVLGFVLPILLLAVAFTVLNLTLSIHRSRETLNWSSPVARGTQRLMVIMTVLVPVLLLSLGLLGPVPVAIILYWFANNLWTLTQATIIQFIINRKMPFDDEYREHHRQNRDIAKEADREKRAYKRSVRRRRVAGLVRPWRIPEIHRELASEKAERTRTKAERKAGRKALEKAKRASRKELNRDKLARRREQRQARRKGTDAGDAKSSSPPEEPAASDAPDPGRSPAD